MRTWFVLVPIHISTRRINSLILQLPYLARPTLKLSKMATCLYMPINRRRCTLLWVLDFHRNSLISKCFSIVTRLLPWQPSPTVLPVPLMNSYALLHSTFPGLCLYHIVVTRSSYRFRFPKLFHCNCMLTVDQLQVYLLSVCFYFAKVLETHAHFKLVCLHRLL